MALIKPEQIPDEVVEAACRAYTSIMLDIAPELAISEAIAAALAAERERCAKIAEEIAGDGDRYGDMNVQQCTGEDIAAAIRGEKP